MEDYLNLKSWEIEEGSDYWAEKLYVMLLDIN